MQVDLLCSGSKGNSCLIRTKNSSLLIDCGSTKKYLMNALGSVNQRVDDLNALLVTHAHTDHVSQLKHFRHLPVYSYCDLKDLDNHHIVRPLQEFDINEFHIQVISLSHDSPNTVGYVIYADGKKLVYITDTGYLNRKYFPLLENKNIYYIESNHDEKMLMDGPYPYYLKQRIISDEGHLSNETTAKYLKKLVGDATKYIILAHLSEHNNKEEIAYNTSRESLKDRSDIKIVVAKQSEALEEIEVYNEINMCR